MLVTVPTPAPTECKSHDELRMNDFYRVVIARSMLLGICDSSDSGVQPPDHDA